MQRVWVALLAGSIGFGCHSSSGNSNANDAGPDAQPVLPDGTVTQTDVCVKLKDTTYNIDWSGCTSAEIPDSIELTQSASIDTMTGSSTTIGLNCLVIPVQIVVAGAMTEVDVCAIAAGTLKIDAGVKLSASGKRPLVLFGHSVDIEGTVDVASHINGQRGAGSDSVGCNPSLTSAKADGGAAGGSYGTTGGKGGDQGGQGNSGGPAGGTIAAQFFRGGCDAGNGGDGTNNPKTGGGAGGGAVWIVSDMGMLKIGSAAVINASGAGGMAGKTPGGGGSGGGSGGMIVLQSTILTLDPNAQIYANGGGGGGGALGANAGTNGGDPSGIGDGGGTGLGGKAAKLGSTQLAMPPVGLPGDGGSGYHHGSKDADDGGAGDTAMAGGGGGGGGGGGTVRAASNTTFDASNVSPAPVQWDP
jgi:hypothetical protein